MKLKDLKIGVQLGLGLGAILLLVAALGALAWVDAGALWRQAELSFDHPFLVRRTVSEIQIHVLTMHRNMKDLCLVEAAQERQVILDDQKAREAEMKRLLMILYDRYLGPRSDIVAIEHSLERWKIIREETSRLVFEGKGTEAIQRTRPTGAGGAQVNVLLAELNRVGLFAQNKAEDLYRNAKVIYNGLQRQLAGGILAIFLLSLFIAWRLFHEIRSPLVELTAVTEQFRQGRWEGRSGYASGNELGLLAASFNRMAETIQTELRTNAQLILAARDSAARFRAIIEASPVAMAVYDEAGKITYLNPAFTRGFGYEQADLPSLAAWWGHVSSDLRPRPELATTGQEEWSRAQQAGMVFTPMELTLRGKDGTERSVMASAVSLAPGPKSDSLLLLYDITERKQAEAEHDRLTVQNQQLQKAESLGRMAAAIAHHFNNKMQAVIGNLELESSDPARALGPSEALTAAMQAARMAAEVSTQMLTYLGHSSHKTEVLDLSAICQRSAGLWRAATPPTTKWEIDLPTPGPPIQGNVGQIKTLLNNLVTNALEAHGDKGGIIHLTVKTVAAAEIPTVHRFPLGWQPEATPYACLEVADTGCGIAARDIDSLFDPFFSSKFTGRGLGLSVVLGVVRTHHGVITVESRVREGSVFRVFLPVAVDGIPVVSESLAPFPEITARAMVLVIEDEPSVRRAVVLTLQKLRFGVMAAENGPEGVQLFQQHQEAIDCVLCDVSLPRMDGWETLAALRKLAPGLPVILCSGYHESLVMAGHHAEKPSAFLGKPYSIERLQRTLSHVLAQRKGRRGQGEGSVWS